MTEPQCTIENLKKAKPSFQDYIDYIRFPYFRNLNKDTRINFDFPFSVFVGPNGCGKSSALQAIYGAPRNYTLGHYWFSTVIDPISDPETNHRHCFIYSYNGKGPQKEVLKRRSYKTGEPDLWDTSPAIAEYGMENPDKRGLSPINKNVVYLNFRASQNAFEKKFHEERPPTRGIQDWLRKRYKSLKRALTTKQTQIGRFRSKTNDIPIELSKEAVLAAGKIIGRNYKGASIIKHRFFGMWGYSVILKTSHATYSEAVSGSGESTAFLLAHEVLTAPDNTLLLLDEPETSLHPGAQKELRNFLLTQCLIKKLQVVVCTHSPSIVEGLPKSAIKVFTQLNNHKFSVFENINYNEAFHFIGQELENKREIIVEDKLAKEIVESVLREMGQAAGSAFQVTFRPGGDSAIKQAAVVYSSEHMGTKYILLDADKNPKTEITNPESLPASVYTDPDTALVELNNIVDSMDCHPSFPRDGGSSGGNKIQEIESKKRYIKYFLTLASS
jgi:predicted ATPase